MEIQRNWVTPITAGAFLLSAVTGILIFFHLDSGGNKFVHEWLGLVLIAGAILHVLANFAGFKLHLTSLRGQLLIGVFVVTLFISFVSIGNEKSEPPFVQPIRALSQASLTTLAQVAQITPGQLREQLLKAGLQSTSDQQSLSDLVGSDTKKQMRVLGLVFARAK